MSVRLRAKGAGEARSENGSGHTTSVKSEGDIYGKHSDSRRESGYCCWWYVDLCLPTFNTIKHLSVYILVHIMCARRHVHARAWHGWRFH
jgi:hypothetical protein